MEFLIIENNIITNVIIADESFAAEIGALPYYDGAKIGDTYSPPEPPPDDITALQLAAAELAETQAAVQTQNELAMAELASMIGG